MFAPVLPGQMMFRSHEHGCGAPIVALLHAPIMTLINIDGSVPRSNPVLKVNRKLSARRTQFRPNFVPIF